MKEVKKIESGCYYMFESLSSGRSCYFESNEEIEEFKRMFEFYVGKYVEVHKMYFSSQGYQVLIKVRDRRTLISNYMKDRVKKGKGIRADFIESPWRIVSDKMRIMMSTYVKKVNKLREREGVLVKSSYKRFYFENEEELKVYIREREMGAEILSQRNSKYGVSKRWKELVNWGRLRARGVAEMSGVKGFHDFVLRKLVETTFTTHSPLNSSSF